jgi:hypothetical protein
VTITNNPIIQELGPRGPWLVDLLDGQGDRKVTWHQDHELCGDIFECACGTRYSWSKRLNLDEACKHIMLACLAALRIVDEI